MADNNWTILPEFDEGHQNRYIVMVSDRPVADDVAKKFPKICSEPFELKNDKYSWGLYVDNSTRDDRKNIYKFFLGETASVQELKKEEEIKEVILELNNIFSTLTKAEQRHIEEEIPAKIESIEKFAEKKSEEKIATAPAEVISADASLNISAIRKEEKPQDAAIVLPAVSQMKVPILTPETKTEISTPSVSIETKQETPAEMKIEIERFGEPTSSSVSYPAKKEVSAASLPVVKETAVPSQPAPSVPVATTGLSSQGLPSVVAVPHSEVPILTPETKTEISTPSVSIETKQETPAEMKIEIERFGESATLVSSVPEKKETPVVSPLIVKETVVPSQPAPSVSSTESIKVGYLYPLPSPESLAKFINQLKMITEKSMKIPIYLEKVSETGYNTTGPNDFNLIISAAKLKKADIILAVIPDGIDDIRLFIDTACRRNEILYMVAQQSQLDKKFLFVDMAIELLLIKKKLR